MRYLDLLFSTLWPTARRMRSHRVRRYAQHIRPAAAAAPLCPPLADAIARRRLALSMPEPGYPALPPRPTDADVQACRRERVRRTEEDRGQRALAVLVSISRQAVAA